MHKLTCDVASNTKPAYLMTMDNDFLIQQITDPNRDTHIHHRSSNILLLSGMFVFTSLHEPRYLSQDHNRDKCPVILSMSLL